MAKQLDKSLCAKFAIEGWLKYDNNIHCTVPLFFPYIKVCKVFLDDNPKDLGFRANASDK